MMAAVSQSTADGMHGSERTLGSQPVQSLSHRLERIELLNETRLSLPDVVGGRGRSIVPTVRSSQSTGKGVQRGGEGTEETPNGAALMSVFAAFVNGLTTESLGSTGLEEVETAWLHEFRKKLTSALDVGRFLEMWNIRETHPKGRPVRTLLRYRMCAPDPALQEDAQSITKLVHILRKVLLHHKGTEQEGPVPPTNNERKIQSQLEQRRKKVTSMRQIWQNRRPCGVLERKTRSSNELLLSSGVTPLNLM